MTVLPEKKTDDTQSPNKTPDVVSYPMIRFAPVDQMLDKTMIVPHESIDIVTNIIRRHCYNVPFDILFGDTIESISEMQIKFSNCLRTVVQDNMELYLQSNNEMIRKLSTYSEVFHGEALSHVKKNVDSIIEVLEKVLLPLRQFPLLKAMTINSKESIFEKSMEFNLMNPLNPNILKENLSMRIGGLGKEGFVESSEFHSEDASDILKSSQLSISGGYVGEKRVTQLASTEEHSNSYDSVWQSLFLSPEMIYHECEKYIRGDATEATNSSFLSEGFSLKESSKLLCNEVELFEKFAEPENLTFGERRRSYPPSQIDAFSTAYSQKDSPLSAHVSSQQSFAPIIPKENLSNAPNCNYLNGIERSIGILHYAVRALENLYNLRTGIPRKYAENSIYLESGSDDRIFSVLDIFSKDKVAIPIPIFALDGGVKTYSPSENDIDIAISSLSSFTRDLPKSVTFSNSIIKGYRMFQVVLLILKAGLYVINIAGKQLISRNLSGDAFDIRCLLVWMVEGSLCTTILSHLLGCWRINSGDEFKTPISSRNLASHPLKATEPLPKLMTEEVSDDFKEKACIPSWRGDTFPKHPVEHFLVNHRKRHQHSIYQHFLSFYDKAILWTQYYTPGHPFSGSSFKSLIPLDFLKTSKMMDTFSILCDMDVYSSSDSNSNLTLSYDISSIHIDDLWHSILDISIRQMAAFTDNLMSISNAESIEASSKFLEKMESNRCLGIEVICDILTRLRNFIVHCLDQLGPTIHSGVLNPSGLEGSFLDFLRFTTAKKYKPDYIEKYKGAREPNNEESDLGNISNMHIDPENALNITTDKINLLPSMVIDKLSSVPILTEFIPFCFTRADEGTKGDIPGSTTEDDLQKNIMISSPRSHEGPLNTKGTSVFESGTISFVSSLEIFLNFFVKLLRETGIALKELTKSLGMSLVEIGWKAIMGGLDNSITKLCPTFLDNNQKNILYGNLLTESILSQFHTLVSHTYVIIDSLITRFLSFTTTTSNRYCKNDMGTISPFFSYSKSSVTSEQRSMLFRTLLELRHQNIMIPCLEISSQLCSVFTEHFTFQTYLFWFPLLCDSRMSPYSVDNSNTICHTDSENIERGTNLDYKNNFTIKEMKTIPSNSGASYRPLSWLLSPMISPRIDEHLFTTVAPVFVCNLLMVVSDFFHNFLKRTLNIPYSQSRGSQRDSKNDDGGEVALITALEQLYIRGLRGAIKGLFLQVLDTFDDILWRICQRMERLMPGFNYDFQENDRFGDVLMALLADSYSIDMRMTPWLDISTTEALFTDLAQSTQKLSSRYGGLDLRFSPRKSKKYVEETLQGWHRKCFETIMKENTQRFSIVHQPKKSFWDLALPSPPETFNYDHITFEAKFDSIIGNTSQSKQTPEAISLHTWRAVHLFSKWTKQLQGIGLGRNHSHLCFNLVDDFLISWFLTSARIDDKYLDSVSDHIHLLSWWEFSVRCLFAESSWMRELIISLYKLYDELNPNYGRDERKRSSIGHSERPMWSSEMKIDGRTGGRSMFTTSLNTGVGLMPLKNSPTLTLPFSESFFDKKLIPNELVSILDEYTHILHNELDRIQNQLQKLRKSSDNTRSRRDPCCSQLLNNSKKF